MCARVKAIDWDEKHDDTTLIMFILDLKMVILTWESMETAALWHHRLCDITVFWTRKWLHYSDPQMPPWRQTDNRHEPLWQGEARPTITVTSVSTKQNCTRVTVLSWFYLSFILLAFSCRLKSSLFAGGRPLDCTWTQHQWDLHPFSQICFPSLSKLMQ